jgi:hypothetical protein
MAALAVQLLTLAMSLIMAVKNNPAAPAAQRAQAISTANYAIQVATQTLAALKAAPQTPTSTPSSLPPAPPPLQATSSLGIKVNTAIGALRFSPGSPNQVVGSYLLSAAGPETINITTTTITLGSQGARTFANLKLFSNGIQIGDTIFSATSTDKFVFAGRFLPIAVSPGIPVRVDVFADILAGGGGMNSATTFAECSAFVGASTTTVPCPSLSGQGITVGSPSLAASQNPNTSIAPLIKSRVEQKIGSYLLAASYAEDIKLSSFTITTGGSADIVNVRVVLNGAKFGITQNGGPGSALTFSDTPITIAAGSNSTVLDVYADVLLAPSLMSPATSFTGCSAAGALSGTLFYSCGYAAGQNTTIAE